MASNAQLTANRANATQSTGPRTAEGKDRTSLNSLTHGLSRSKIFLPGEQPEDFEEMQRDIARSYDCSTPAEIALCAEAALAWWKLRRIAEWQNEVIEQGLTGPDLTPELARLFGPTHEAALKTLHRYETSAHSIFNRAITQLRIHQKQRDHRPLVTETTADSPARQGGDSENRANPIPQPPSPTTAVERPSIRHSGSKKAA